MNDSTSLDLMRIHQLLFGLDATGLKESDEQIWIKPSAFDDNQTFNSAQIDESSFVFTPYPVDRPYLQLQGDLGIEGDEAVFADGIIVETCSLTGIDYIEPLGLTYISIETEADEQQLQDLLAEFKETGKLAACFAHPGIVFELAGFSPEKFPNKRSFIDESGCHSWPISEIIMEIRETEPKLCTYFVYAVILSRKLGDMKSNFTFDLPERGDCAQSQQEDLENVILAHTGTEYRCMNTTNGKVFSIGYDMYRAVLSVLSPTKYATLPGEPLQSVLIDQALRSLQGKLQQVR